MKLKPSLSEPRGERSELYGTMIFMYWVYVLENCDDKSRYIGSTSDLKQRLREHQQGSGVRTTRIKKNWQLIYCEGYLNKQDALGRERFLKSGAGRKFLKKQLLHYLEA